MMRRIIIITLAVLLVGFSAAGKSESDDQKKITLMLYICGTNLESEYGAATADYFEMLSSGVDLDQVNLVLMLGGASEWNYVPFNSGKTVIRDPLTNVWEKEGINMGDPETLNFFMDYCVEAYPADKFALILWDHGAGPVNGICWDERFDGDHLTIEKLRNALENSPFKRKKLDWIGFDACLMSSVEVACLLSPYAEYMIASQAEEPVDGWNYTFLKGLEEDTNGAETARRIIDAYFDTTYQTEMDLTLSCIDLGKVSEIESCMDQMYLQIEEMLDSQTFPRFSQMRFSATEFGKGAGVSQYDLVDLVALSNSYSEIDPIGAARLIDAVEAAVVVNRSNMENSFGISAYHPYRNREKYVSQWQRVYQDLNFCPGYTRYINTYGRIMTGETLVSWKGLSDIKVLEEGNDERSNDTQEEKELDYMIMLDLSPEQAINISSARLVILARNLYDTVDDAWFRVYSTSASILDETRLVAWYDGKALQVVDEYGYAPLTSAISYEFSEDGLLLINLYPRQGNVDLLDYPIIAEYINSEDGTPLKLKDYLVYDRMTESYTQRADIDWVSFSGIRFQNTYRNKPVEQENGYPAFDMWEEDAHTSVQWFVSQEIDTSNFLLTFALDLARGEDLYAAFEITDTQGYVHTSEMVPLSELQVIKEHFEGSDFSLAREARDIITSLRTNWASHQVEMMVEVTNHSWADPTYFLDILSLNEIDISPQVFWKTEEGNGVLEEQGVTLYVNILNPEIVCFSFTLGPEILPMLHTDNTPNILKGKLRIQTNMGEESFIPLSAVLDFPILYLSHTQEDIPLPDRDYVLSTFIPDLQQDSDIFQLSSDVVIRKGYEAEYATVIMNVSMFNAGDKEIEIELSYLRIDSWSMLYSYTVDDERMKQANIVAFYTTGKVAPGEKAVVSYTLQYDAGLNFLDGMPPNVSLQELSFSLFIYQYKDKQLFDQAVIPVVLETNASLTDLYADAEFIPSQELINQMGRSNCFFESQSEMLFSADGCNVLLQSIFLEEDIPVLLLRMKNDSDEIWYISLAEATVDNITVEIGQTVDKFVGTMNNRLSIFQLVDQLWIPQKSAAVTLQPHSERFHFVSLASVNGLFEEIRTITMRAMIFSDSTRHENDMGYYSPAEIYLPNSIQLPVESEVYILPQECDIIPGEPVQTEVAGKLICEEIIVGDASAATPVHLHIDAPNGMQIDFSHYILLRRIGSSREAASRGIWMMGNSFIAHPEWLLYEALGYLNVSEDGSNAEGEIPNLLPGIQTSKGMISFPVAQIVEDEMGKIQFHQLVSKCILDTSKYYNSKTGIALEGPIITIDNNLDNINMELPSSWWQRRSYYPSLFDLLCVGYVPIIPADVSSSNEIYEALYNEDASYVLIFHEITEHQIQFVLAPLTNLDDYEIMFFVRLTNGDSYYTLPRPITDYTE